MARDLYTPEDALRRAERDVRFAGYAFDPAYYDHSYDVPLAILAYLESPKDCIGTAQHAVTLARIAHRKWFDLRVAESVLARVKALNTRGGMRDYAAIERHAASMLTGHPMEKVYYSPMGRHHFGEWERSDIMARELEERRAQDLADMEAYRKARKARRVR